MGTKHPMELRMTLNAYFPCFNVASARIPVCHCAWFNCHLNLIRQCAYDSHFKVQETKALSDSVTSPNLHPVILHN